jgi:RHS repeat-associated protein
MPLRFPGQFADAETGLLYNVFRYYDPVNARYISSDPLGQEPGPNTYAYVTNPTTLTDPLGLSPCGDAVDAGTPVGRRVVTKTFYDEAGNATGKAKYGWELKVAPGTNSPAVIGGRSYSGHALDQMQGRGILPSAVEDAIGYSTPAPSRGGTSVFYSSANDLSVVVNSEGRVVTTSFGDLR